MREMDAIQRSLRDRSSAVSREKTHLRDNRWNMTLKDELEPKPATLLTYRATQNSASHTELHPKQDQVWAEPWHVQAI